MKLSDLQPQVIEVEIAIIGDEKSEPMVVPLRPLTYSEFMDAQIGIEWPDVPEKQMLKDGKKTTVKDQNDPDYQQALAEANLTLGLRRLAKALEGGGFAELKGLDREAQVDLLRGLDTGIVNALLDILARMARRKRAEVFRG